MDFDLETKMAIYRRFAATGARPSVAEIARDVDAGPAAVLEAFGRLRAKRVLVLEEDGASIRMAPPFSGIPTQHVVTAAGRRYFANCAWDSFGILVALHATGVVESECGESGEPYRLEVSAAGPGVSDWLFHCAVPAARWWHDIVFT